MLAFFLPSCARSFQIINNFNYQTVDENGEEYYLYENLINDCHFVFLAFYGYNDDANISYSFDTNCKYDSSCVKDTIKIKDVRGLWIFQDAFYGITYSNMRARSGSISKSTCPDGAYITNNPDFDFADFINDPTFAASKVRCFGLVCEECSSKFTSKLDSSDTLEYMQWTNSFSNISPGTEQQLTSDSSRIIFLRVTKGQSTARRESMPLNVEYTQGTKPTAYDLWRVNTSLPDSRALPFINLKPFQPPTIEQVTRMTLLKTQEQTPRMSLLRTQQQTLEKTLTKTHEQTPEKATSKTEEQTSETPPTLAQTPVETWDGQWEEQPGEIVKGDDIPEIRETHMPLQTEYIKTEVSVAEAATNISFGVIIIVIIIILTIINIIKTTKTLRKGKLDEIEASSIELETDDFFDNSSETSEYITSEESGNINLNELDRSVLMDPSSILGTFNSSSKRRKLG